MITKDALDRLTSTLGRVRLMAVSKLHTSEEVLAMYGMGQRLFGENHLQEIVQKFAAEDGRTCNRPSDLELHMIGHLQSNKVNRVVPLVDMIESVDSAALLRKIDASCSRIGKRMDVLLELNTSGEASKSGFATEDDLLDCLRESRDLQNIVVRGLMTVGPLDADPDRKTARTREAFRRLKVLFDALKKDYPQFDTLSMGMSGDWEIAVEEGSTEVRIGTMLFGERKYDV